MPVSRFHSRMLLSVLPERPNFLSGEIATLWIEPLWPKLGRVWVGEAQRLRDRLGSHHDLHLLSALTRPNKRPGTWQERLLPLIRERQREHLRVAARLAGRLFAEKPNAFRSRLMRLWEGRSAAMAD